MLQMVSITQNKYIVKLNTITFIQPKPNMKYFRKWKISQYLQ